MKCDGTRAENRCGLSAKRTSPFKSAGASVQSTTGSRGVRISGNNAGSTVFRGSVKSTGYQLHSPVSPPLPLPASPRVIRFQLDSDVEDHGRPQTTIWRMRISCWLSKSTETRSDYLVLTAFPLQQWLRERVLV